MQYRINEVKLKVGQSAEDIPKAILKKLGKAGRGITITDWRITRQSVDARDKKNIFLVYGVDFDTLTGDRKLDLPTAEPREYILPMCGEKVLSSRPVICGFGPAGMYAALILAEAGFAPIVLERGAAMEKRIRDVEKYWHEGKLDPESNVQFGEGGAGTFSDGKLTTNLKDPRIYKILKEFADAGANPEILYLHKPHIGTDVLRDVVVNIRKRIEALGGEILFETRLEGLKTEEGRLSAAVLSSTEALKGRAEKLCKCTGENGKRKLFEIETDILILAPGHSARDTFRMLQDAGVRMSPKPFSIGVRIQHSQDMINRAQYGEGWEKLGLPPAEYKLSYHCKKAEDGGKNDGRGVYTFCMCPGGEVIASASEEGTMVTNGMSYSSRDGEFANSAVLTDVRISDFGSSDPLAGAAFQEKYEKKAFENGGGGSQMPRCTYGEFKKAFEERSAGCTAQNPVLDSIPDFAASAMMEAMPAFGRKLRGFDSEDSILFAVESRSSSPVRIDRDEELVACIQGLYPCGEGAGYAGGIVSAALDGIRVAEEIIKKFRPAED